MLGLWRPCGTALKGPACIGVRRLARLHWRFASKQGMVDRMDELKAKLEKSSDWAVPFKIVSVTKSDGPAGTEQKDWYRYVISQGNDPIIGLRRGTKKSVVEAAEEIVFSLNERLVGKPGRVHVKYRKESKNT